MTTLAALPGPSPSAPSPRRSVLGLIVAGVAPALLLFPLVLCALLAPKFMEIFKDFGVALPAMTRLLLRAGLALSSPLAWVTVFLGVALLVAPLAYVSGRNRVAGVLTLSFAFLLCIIGVLVLMISMYLPLVTMIESLQQGGAV